MLSGLFARLRLDPRMSSMIAALLVIAIALNVMTGGLFLSAENLYNLSIQTCVIAVMACGMVYVIVARQIDLSVGKLGSSQIACESPERKADIGRLLGEIGR